MAMPEFGAGQWLVAADLRALAQQIDASVVDIAKLEAAEIGYAYRDTPGTATAAVEQPYLRLDNLLLENGESYFAFTPPLIIDSTVAADLVQVALRYSLSGVATTASTQLTLLAQPSKSASGAQNTAMLGKRFTYTGGGTGVMSLLLSFVRSAGTGNVRINATATIPAEITVVHLGTLKANSGVSLP